MKVLVLSDIQNYEEYARMAFDLEKPDLVLDCGDHSRISNLFDLVPHFYIHGNHEPNEIGLDSDSLPLPHKIQTGNYYFFKKDSDVLRFSGLDGHYSSRGVKNSIKSSDIEALTAIGADSLDVFLLHESPLNVKKEEKGIFFATKIIEELERIRPKITYAGHVGVYSEKKTPGGVSIITLDNLTRGYCVLDFSNKNLTNIRRYFNFRKVKF